MYLDINSSKEVRSRAENDKPGSPVLSGSSGSIRVTSVERIVAGFGVISIVGQ